MICGQEIGTKEYILRLGSAGKYPSDKKLMIGDAPGDLEAAQAVGALFYPINPGHEEESWEKFYKEGYKRFLEGTYSGEYEKRLIEDFEKLLPEIPPWKR
jgi:histidinol phosphatase-like enzyme